MKATTSKHVETTANDADNVSSDDDRSSSSSEDLNFRGFSREEKDAVDAIIAKRVGKETKRAILFYIDKTSNIMKEKIRKELEELKKKGVFMKGSSHDRATYRDFTACDVPKFMGDLNPIVSTRWITSIEGAFRTSECEDKNKVNFATNFLRGSAKIWWEGKMCEKGEDWVGSCSWKEFKEMFSAKYAPMKEIGKIREEFYSLVQTKETVNEL
ncbi:zinc finger, CCHC-type, retrotransposon gag domain protein [Tanacetum coccineum]